MRSCFKCCLHQCFTGADTNPIKMFSFSAMLFISLFSLSIFPVKTEAGCTTTAGTPTIIECTGGDLGSGILKTVSSGTRLNVFDLTTDIDTSDIGVSLNGKGSKGDNGGYDVILGGTNGNAGTTGPKVTLYHKGTVITSNTGISVISSGGDGGNGANGGQVIALISEGSITTSGDNNYGIQAVSQGGDGGNGGNVLIENNVGGDITTTGDYSHAIYAQSVAGGGGDGGASGGLYLSLGGEGSEAGSTGAVTLTNWATLETSGTNANGIFAQSVGGGGGGGDGGSSIGSVSVGGGSVAMAVLLRFTIMAI